jgi:hypothetical protein
VAELNRPERIVCGAAGGHFDGGMFISLHGRENNHATGQPAYTEMQVAVVAA